MKYLIPGLCLMALMSCVNNSSKKKTGSFSNGWKSDSSIHYRLYAQKGVRSEDSLKGIAEKMENIQQELLNMLQESKFQKIDIYLLKDRETLTSYTGFPANGYTNTEKGIIYFVDKEPFHLALRHELMHALSWRLWSYPKDYWISEGLAVYASANCGGYDFHALANAVQMQGKLVPFRTLVDSFDFKAIEPSIQSASMVKYIHETYGVKALKGFWDQGWQDTQTITGISSAELEKKWKEHIKQKIYQVSINWNLINKHGCE